MLSNCKIMPNAPATLPDGYSQWGFTTLQCISSTLHGLAYVNGKYNFKYVLIPKKIRRTSQEHLRLKSSR